MSSPAPDPLALEHWEDAFRHPVPLAKSFEQQLRNHAEANRQKLRTIVGASYRELLETADRIITMDQQIKSVENTLAETAHKCNSTALQKLFVNTATFHSALSSQRQLYSPFPQTVVLPYEHVIDKSIGLDNRVLASRVALRY